LRGYEIGKEVRWVARSSKSDELREQAGWGEQQEGSGEEARGWVKRQDGSKGM
jgi:hypothetical protein